MTSPTYSAGDASSYPKSSPTPQRFGSADAADRSQGGNSPWSKSHVLGYFGSETYDTGAILFDVLSLPGTAGPGEDGRYGTEDDTSGIGPEDVVTWTIDETTGRSTQMTMAGALAWLRNLALTNRDGYDAIVMQLVQADYLTPESARYGTYTTDVAGAFLQSVIDVYHMNSDGDGAIVTWGDHIDALIQGRINSGQLGPDGNPLGAGSEALPPTRLDQYTDEMTVRASLKQASMNSLGRALTDQEEAAFLASFRSLEEKWNDERYNASLAQFNGQNATVTSSPSPVLAADEFIDQQHGTEQTAQAFGSYMGVLRNMVGLGGAGIGGNVA